MRRWRAPSRWRDAVPVDGLFFTSEDGRLNAVEAMPVDSASGQLLGSTNPLWSGHPNGVPVGTGLSAPVVSRGLVQVLARDDDTAPHYWLFLVDAATGETHPDFQWWHVGPTAQTGLPRIELGDNIKPDNSVLPPVASTLIRDERTGAVADVTYATLPTGSLAAVATRVTGEVARFVGYREDAGAIVATQYELMHPWVQERPLNVAQYRGNQAIPVTGNVVPDTANVRRFELIGKCRAPTAWWSANTLWTSATRTPRAPPS